MGKVFGKLFKAKKFIVPGEVKREAGDEESVQRGESGQLDPIHRDNSLLSGTGDICVVPGGVKGKQTDDEEIPQRRRRRRLDPISCDNELPSTSEDIIVIPGGMKRKRTEDGEIPQNKTHKRLESIPSDTELPSSSEDISVIPGGVKRKRTEDGESQQSKKRKRLEPIPCDTELPSSSEDISVIPGLEPIPCDTELPSSSEDTESRNAPDSLIFKAKYQQLHKLGEGGYGCVFAGYRIRDNLPVAIKRIYVDTNLHLYRDGKGGQIPMEVAILRKLAAESERFSAPINLLDWYIVDPDLILVLERPMPAVDLHNYIANNGGCLTEAEAKIIIKQLVDAAIDLGWKHIFHRDIKVENLLIETCNTVPRVRLIDFGLSCFYNEGDTFINFYGTYTPPEWHSRKEYQAGPATVFQIGVVLFLMRQKMTYKKGMSFLELTKTPWLSEDGNDFFKACLYLDPDMRFTLDQLKNHPWLRATGEQTREELVR
ncbi:Serine/threonine-protein kinase pim-2 [Liparis tanakae]|uniref:non-specific serine/threonine protein kinase n=1 Tax=Liparis tanakae TaxID=230148 RepID=A0A4Z2HG72_9TELE|nr:Serine/threonine-protein kinase pim-2 [Liparis tanakae]